MDDLQADWVVVDVADQTQLGTGERIKEKIIKLSQLTHDSSRRKQEAELCARKAESREQASERRRQAAERGEQEAERRAQEAERSRQEAERSRQEAERRRREAEHDRQEAERSRQEAEKTVQDAEKNMQEADRKRQEFERSARVAERSKQESESFKDKADRDRKESDKNWREAERIKQEMEERLHEVEKQYKEVEQRLEETQDSAQARAAEAAMAETIQRYNRQVQQLEERIRDSEMRLVQEQARRAREAVQSAGENGRQWLVKRAEIHMTDEKLGKGGWAKVRVAEFRGLRVAAKRLFKELQTPFYHNAFIREMNMASRVRHPNLVQFIGASMDDEMVILMELMPTSLRQHLASNAPAIPSAAFSISVSLDVAKALNYLHLMQPDPIIHRDISCANVLLEPLPNHMWRAKVTDYGSVNLQSQLSTKNPGNPVYAAPESHNEALQSSKMDIFSYGILLLTMCTAEFPVVSKRDSMIHDIQDRRWADMIRQCIHIHRDQKPSASQLISELNTWK